MTAFIGFQKSACVKIDVAAMFSSNQPTKPFMANSVMNRSTSRSLRS